MALNLGNLCWPFAAEGYGLPAAYPNGSIVAQAFQVNRDGGGPMSCEYNEVRCQCSSSIPPLHFTHLLLEHQGRYSEVIQANDYDP